MIALHEWRGWYKAKLLQRRTTAKLRSDAKQNLYSWPKEQKKMDSLASVAATFGSRAVPRYSFPARVLIRGVDGYIDTHLPWLEREVVN